MISGSAGGHTFVWGVCQCGTKLVDIQWVTKEDVGKSNIAHAGTVTVYEIDQIMALSEQMRKQVETAFGWR